VSATPTGAERDDVLNAFAMEDEHGKVTLERYLLTYPHFAGDLIDLSRSLLRPVVVDESPRTADDEIALENAWTLHKAVLAGAIIDPFAEMPPARSREVATALEVPRQIITAFRERSVIPDSVPRGFLRRFAAEMQQSLDQFALVLTMPRTTATARSFKADGKPGDLAQVSFERLLIDANVAEDVRTRLLADND
jgi:hypothetical protein